MSILHIGHVRWSSNHGSTQLLWNVCLQVKITCLSRKENISNNLYEKKVKCVKRSIIKLGIEIFMLSCHSLNLVLELQIQSDTML